jgi:hypothetical protein
MKKIKDAWMLNLLLALSFAGIYALVAFLQTPAYAAGGSWETDGVMVGTTENDNERFVLVDTLKKRVMIYKTAGAGEFRLVTARSYKYDVEMQDTSKNQEIEKKGGINFQRAYEMFHNKQ